MLNRQRFAAAPNAACPESSAAGVPPGKKPHVLLLMADQFRADCLGVAGNTVVRTPHLDRLAREGAWFRCAYSSVPSCIPARAGLLTGMSPWGHGLLGFSPMAEKYPVEMPRLMKNAGYYAMAIGKCHFRPQRNLHGFDTALLDEAGQENSIDFRSDYHSWFWSVAPNLDPNASGLSWNGYTAAPYPLEEDLHETSWTGETAVRFLKTHKTETPFFLKVSFHRPHSPYDPPERLFDSYAGADLPEAQTGDWAKERYAARSGPGVAIWHGDVGDAETRKARQGYYGSVTHVDEQIGRILDVLRERGLMEDTLIVFLSDHGDMLGDQHLWRKTYAYEASARIPMIVRWPDTLLKANRGTVFDQPVELRDVLPTLLEGTGAEIPAEIEGRSLLNLIRGQKEWRAFIDLEHDNCYKGTFHWNALTDGKTKYIFHPQNGEEQLFDLTRDPYEQHNAATDSAYAETLHLWHQRLVDHLAPRGPLWVQNGTLQQRRGSDMYSPNYPEEIPRAAADTP